MTDLEGAELKEKARDLHYSLIEHFGLNDSPEDNSKVRMLIMLSISSAYMMGLNASKGDDNG